MSDTNERDEQASALCRDEQFRAVLDALLAGWEEYSAFDLACAAYDFFERAAAPTTEGGRMTGVDGQDARIAAVAEIIGHYYCEDCWYSCPLAPEGCCNDAYPKDECNCGVMEKARRIVAALAHAAVPSLPPGAATDYRELTEELCEDDEPNDAKGPGAL